MAQPLFVIGKPRSGTKWLSNIISNHADVACVQRHGDSGILDSNVFAYMPDVFGDLSIDENYFGFLACFAKTSFFRLTGLDESVLYSERINDYNDIFRMVMDCYAEKVGKVFWVQKASVADFPGIYPSFPDAKFVVIQREIEAHIRSARAMRISNVGRGRGIFFEVCQYWFARQTAEQFRSAPNVMMVEYEQLREERESAVRRMASFLGLEYTDEFLVDRFRKNTSFASETARREILSSRDVFLMRLYSPIVRRVPYRVWTAIARPWRSIQGRRPRRFLRRTFELDEPEGKEIE